MIPKALAGVKWNAATVARCTCACVCMRVCICTCTNTRFQLIE